MAQTASAQWAPEVRTGKIWQYLNHLRSLVWVQLTHDNILAWRWGLRGSRELEDIEGPLYIFGAPSRQIEDGKAVLASEDILKKGHVYVFILELKDAKGDPLPYADVDLWQTDADGGYYVSTYTLRGKAKADAKGHLEVLTVRPGEYPGRNVGHIHIVLSGTVNGKFKTLTTQAYICPGNDATHMENDMLTYWRPFPAHHVAKSWSVGAANKGYFDLPELPAEDLDAAKSVAWWSGKLKDKEIGRDVVAVGMHALKLT